MTFTIKGTSLSYGDLCLQSPAIEISVEQEYRQLLEESSDMRHMLWRSLALSCPLVPLRCLELSLAAQPCVPGCESWV
jgi:hypothetical protein